MIKRFGLAGLSTFVLAGPALAHPGHGADGFIASVTHNFTQADHLAGIVAAGVLAVAVIGFALRRQRTSSTDVRAPRTTS